MTQIWGEPGYYKFLIRSRQEQTDCDHFARQSRSRWGGFLAGWPEDIIEQLKVVEKRYPGLDRVICATPLGTPLNVQLADLDRFAKEVIPAFRDTRTAAAAQ